MRAGKWEEERSFKKLLLLNRAFSENKAGIHLNRFVGRETEGENKTKPILDFLRTLCQLTVCRNPVTPWEVRQSQPIRFQGGSFLGGT